MKFKFCPECGYKFEKEYKFCPECGYKLSGDADSHGSERAAVDFAPDIFDNKKEDFAADDFDLSGLEDAFGAQVEEKEQAGEEYNDALSRARMYCVRNKTAQAKAIYERLLDDDPEDINAHIGLLRVLTCDLTVFDESNPEVEAKLNFLEKLFGKDKLISAEPEMKDFYKIMKATKKNNAEKGERDRVAAILKKAKENYAIAVKIYKKSPNAAEMTMGVYPQSLKADDVTIDFFDPESGYHIGSDCCFYHKYNEKYFKLEPIGWQEKTDGGRRIGLAYADRIIDYTPFAAPYYYSDSALRKLLNDLERKLTDTGIELTKRHLSCEPLVGLKNGGDYIYAVSGTGQVKYPGVTDGVFAPNIEEAEKMTKKSSWNKWYTDYAFERYKVLKGVSDCERPSEYFWTRTPDARYYSNCFVSSIFGKGLYGRMKTVNDLDSFNINTVSGVRPFISWDWKV